MKILLKNYSFGRNAKQIRATSVDHKQGYFRDYLAKYGHFRAIYIRFC